MEIKYEIRKEEDKLASDKAEITKYEFKEISEDCKINFEKISMIWVAD